VGENPNFKTLVLPLFVQLKNYAKFEDEFRLRDDIRARVHAITGITPVVELVPPRTLPRTSSGKLSRTKARSLYLSGEIQPYPIAA
jgi:fatty-acyl-CoA synthase